MEGKLSDTFCHSFYCCIRNAGAGGSVLLFNLYESGRSILSLLGRGNGGEQERRSGEENGLEITRHAWIRRSFL